MNLYVYDRSNAKSELHFSKYEIALGSIQEEAYNENISKTLGINLV